MENKNDLDQFFKSKLSLDELNISDPDLSLVREARNKVLLRKKPVQQKKFSFFGSLAEMRAAIMQLGFCSVMVAGCFLYVSTDKPMKGYVSAQGGAGCSTLNVTTTLTTIQTCITKQ